MMRLHYLQHVPFEGLGCIAAWAASGGHTVSATRLFRNDPLPALDAIDILVIMGGPMSVHDTDRHSWLHTEKRFIDRAIEGGLPVLGICLGAQLIADVLGARVYANSQKEIGWFPVYKTTEADRARLGGVLPHQLDVFHWHGETFDLPNQAVPLAFSEACRHQGFEVDNRVVGLQFHLEIDSAGIAQLVRHCRQELVPGPYIQTAAQLAAPSNGMAHIHHIMHEMLDTLSDL